MPPNSSIKKFILARVTKNTTTNTIRLNGNTVHKQQWNDNIYIYRDLDKAKQ